MGEERAFEDKCQVFSEAVHPRNIRGSRKTSRCIVRNGSDVCICVPATKKFIDPVVYIQPIQKQPYRGDRLHWKRLVNIYGRWYVDVHAYKSLFCKPYPSDLCWHNDDDLCPVPYFWQIWASVFSRFMYLSAPIMCIRHKHRSADFPITVHIHTEHLCFYGGTREEPVRLQACRDGRDGTGHLLY